MNKSLSTGLVLGVTAASIFALALVFATLYIAS
jgi:hypothetical protein